MTPFDDPSADEDLVPPLGDDPSMDETSGVQGMHVGMGDDPAGDEGYEGMSFSGMDDPAND